MSRDLQVVVGICDDQQRCQVPISHDVFSEDPCPNIGKYLEVAYRCRPGKALNFIGYNLSCKDYTFRSWECEKLTHHFKRPHRTT